MNTSENKNIHVNQKICRDFMNKNCKHDSCKFLHDESICFFHWKNNSCKFGDNCKKTHTSSENNKNINHNNNHKNENINTNKKIKNVEKYNKNKYKKNTEVFQPMVKPIDLRVVLDTRSSTKEGMSFPNLTSRDLLLSPNLFNDFGQFEIYNQLVKEIQNCSLEQDNLLKLWHGNDKIPGTHLIADDHIAWKHNCPTFNMVIRRLQRAFNMNIKTTRFNWYREPDHWKPFHHDKSFIDPTVSNTQNFTVAVSFGSTKDVAFEHSETRTVISSPQPDSTVYSFTNDTNAIWRHGILQDKSQELGRISIIAWGWIDNVKQIS